jgi:hypothetical protein
MYYMYCNIGNKNVKAKNSVQASPMYLHECKLVEIFFRKHYYQSRSSTHLPNVYVKYMYIYVGNSFSDTTSH